jgi:hypothetical protein
MNPFLLLRQMAYDYLKGKGDECFSAAIYEYLYGIPGTIAWESGKMAAALAQVFYSLSKAFEVSE